jgi:two-component system, sensor histidine kinase and response regulator
LSRILPALDKPARTQAQPTESHGRILIVDDERDLVQMLSFHLKKRGYETHLAYNGIEAWEELNSARPDLLILDLMMPELDGWELCRLIRRNENPDLRGIPILILSARALPEDRFRGLELGADDYLTKPFSLAELAIRADRILQQKKTVGDLYREIDRLRQQMQEQEASLREVIHDLKNPLLSIGASAKVLMRENPEKEKISFLRNIYQNSLSMTRWLEEILAFSDLSLKNLGKDKEWLDVNSLVKTATELLVPIGQGKKIVVDFQSKELLPPIRGNKRWLQRAVENLITNAFKYTGEGGRIEIKTGLTEMNGARLIEISVKDNGVGIPDEDISKIFEPFYRGRNTKNEKGIGLGLSLVKQVVDLHEGKIEVRSDLGKGSLFSILIPVSAEPTGNGGEKMTF